MSDLDRAWLSAYISVLSIRLHPRNDEGDGVPALDVATEVAVHAANACLEDFQRCRG